MTGSEPRPARDAQSGTVRDAQEGTARETKGGTVRETKARHGARDRAGEGQPRAALGPRQASGLHELCSLFASIDLTDDVTVAPAERDVVDCQPPIEGPNLAAAAVAALREAVSGELPQLRVEIEKRIPVAAGLGGGSADAAAVLRAANRIAGEPLDVDGLRRVAAGIGSDVPSQVEPRHALVSGTGERVDPVGLPAMALVLVPAAEGLSTAAVYEQADRNGSPRALLDAEALRAIASLPRWSGWRGDAQRPRACRAVASSRAGGHPAHPSAPGRAGCARQRSGSDDLRGVRGQGVRRGRGRGFGRARARDGASRVTSRVARGPTGRSSRANPAPVPRLAPSRPCVRMTP